MVDESGHKTIVVVVVVHNATTRDGAKRQGASKKIYW
jgi:hypothetical protein